MFCVWPNGRTVCNSLKTGRSPTKAASADEIKKKHEMNHFFPYFLPVQCQTAGQKYISSSLWSCSTHLAFCENATYRFITSHWSNSASTHHNRHPLELLTTKTLFCSASHFFTASFKFDTRIRLPVKLFQRNKLILR